MTAYARKFEKKEKMSFIVKNKQLLKKYAKMWETIEELNK